MDHFSLETQARSIMSRALTEVGTPALAESSRVWPIKTAENGKHGKIVLLAQTGRDQGYVLKYEPGLSVADFRRVSDALAQAQMAMASEATYKVPQQFWNSEKERAHLLEYVPGPTAFDRLDYAPNPAQQRADVLQDCGGWLAQFHKATQDHFGSNGQRNSSFSWMGRVARNLAEQTRQGYLSPPSPRMFLGQCAMIHRLIRATEGHGALTATLHGDPHLRNFIYGSQGLFAIDFTGRGQGPVELDAVRLMTRVAYRFETAPGSAGLGGIAESDWDNLAIGYGRDLRDTPVLALCLAFQILRDWSRQTEEGARTKVRFKAMKHIFRSLREAGY
ncbi:aminoglycoside phosphotransferase family protein [Cognatishimia maritima]|uniref:Phosphotransferase enzyme family protein n=1 Tax=Cognatishimia maritima TaxID=870908 RepID=A0A1M5NFP1_9RHOB|nr:aminoglycoside phosphotransferase family protein [Cognatishimia maritima]SHG88331.1 Phosphotransferase enzyme family protein [Cognatishimia maritima]